MRKLFIIGALSIILFATGFCKEKQAGKEAEQPAAVESSAEDTLKAQVNAYLEIFGNWPTVPYKEHMAALKPFIHPSAMKEVKSFKKSKYEGPGVTFRRQIANGQRSYSETYSIKAIEMKGDAAIVSVHQVMDDDGSKSEYDYKEKWTMHEGKWVFTADVK